MKLAGRKYLGKAKWFLKKLEDIIDPASFLSKYYIEKPVLNEEQLAQYRATVEDYNECLNAFKQRFVERPLGIEFL